MIKYFVIEQLDHNSYMCGADWNGMLFSKNIHDARLFDSEDEAFKRLLEEIAINSNQKNAFYHIKEVYTN